jgi:hypothetical protein
MLQKLQEEGRPKSGIQSIDKKKDVDDRLGKEIWR